MLAKRIAELRKQNSLKQADLAEKLNISPSTQGMYEQGRRVPPLDVLVEMAKLFSVSLDYLITGSEYTGSVMDPYDKIAENCPCKTCYWKEFRCK